MSKKIGILSMQRVVNFGSVLQAWSLREMIRQATGVQARFVEIQNEPALDSMEVSASGLDYAAPAVYSQCLLQRIKRRVITLLSAYNKRLIRAFMREELQLDAQSQQGPYDCVVVGSDEVFNHVQGIRLQLHGEMPDAKQVITYAASCGTAKAENVKPEDVARVRKAMANFSAVSVRDAGTYTYVQAFYSGKVSHHLDPVLMGPLHSRKPSPVWLKKYLLVYAYGQRIRTAEEINAIKAYAKAKGLRTVAIGGSQFWCDFYVPVSPMRMLDWFAQAECVVTDTFHGVIFSVINHCRFAVMIRPSNQNKLTNLLNDLQLTARRVEKATDLPTVLSKEIDYARVDALLAEQRQCAQAYLKEQLRHE